MRTYLSLQLAEIGYESLRFYGPFQPEHIKQLQINRAINEHANLQMTGLLSEEQGAAWIGQTLEQEPMVIRQLDGQGGLLRRLFHGIITRMSVHCVRGVYTFETGGRLAFVSDGYPGEKAFLSECTPYL